MEKNSAVFKKKLGRLLKGLQREKSLNKTENTIINKKDLT